MPYIKGVVADPAAAYRVTAAAASPNLAGRPRLEPPAADTPQVIYLETPERRYFSIASIG